MPRVLIAVGDAKRRGSLVPSLAATGHDLVTASRTPEVDRRVQPDAFDVLVLSAGDPVSARARDRYTERALEAPVLQVGGKSPDAFESVTDPTDREHLQNALERSVKLANALRERDLSRAELDEVLGHLGAAVDTMRRIRHDVRNSATGLEQALRAVAGKLEIDQNAVLDELRGRFEQIDDCLRRLAVFVGPVRARLASVPLAEVLRQAAERLDIAEVQCPPNLWVHADRALLDEAITALVLRCRRHGAGKLALVAERHPDDASIEARGCAFGPEDESQVAYDLELALCERVAAAHGGRVAEVNGGHLLLELPIEPEPREPS